MRSCALARLDKWTDRQGGLTNGRKDGHGGTEGRTEDGRRDGRTDGHSLLYIFIEACKEGPFVDFKFGF